MVVQFIGILVLFVSGRSISNVQIVRDTLAVYEARLRSYKQQKNNQCILLLTRAYDLTSSTTFFPKGQHRLKPVYTDILRWGRFEHRKKSHNVQP
jgi:hypothetical protein